ncbi:MAG: hypothetical protein IPK11_08755 [Ignavibacteria bacterium]|nr:hypothetical protein [Ignavibacteria bacterium]
MGDFYSAVFNGIGDRVVTASGDKTAKIWDVSTGSLIATLSGHMSLVRSAVFDDIGDKILTASFDSSAKIWNASTGDLVPMLREVSRGRFFPHCSIV